jgi:hypothetical protein
LHRRGRWGDAVIGHLLAIAIGSGNPEDSFKHCQQITAHPSERNAWWMSAACHTARANGETD